MAQEHISVNKDLLLEFFTIFAKFEFALKACKDFRRVGRGGGIEPDWKSFIDSIAGIFNKNYDNKLLEACNYIIEDSPKMHPILSKKRAVYDYSY